MKATVPTAIAQRAVSPDVNALALWASREAAPVLAQTRDFANQLGRERVELTTQGSGFSEQLWESEAMPYDATWTVFAKVTAAGSAYASFGMVAVVRSVGGAVSYIAGTPLWSHASVGITATLTVDPTDRTAILNFNDGGLGTLKVTAVVETGEASVE